ncbi:MAG: TIGR03905 family TSCPD domain-containing protein [Clostridia bacterium]|nr:TIGR03905 family TSCPD domain-containing protein [Clostridia bacterium]MBQ2389640.1 TIGR03905 family TSCPD domain-containing protein [Clostridia bacterium]MBQ9846706.1 TIGR03905 family TSCPD domain-containing protein [Clostridia bacterium]MBQ9957552.1 TIGR03905 family TSCPD domain-containing protein [Clostridia bacterium]
MTYTYTTKGVCARSITIEVENNIVKEVKFFGGCNGNTSGISKLVIGMEIDEVISRLENIRCGFKTTSCPDQLAKALKEIKEKS